MAPCTVTSPEVTLMLQDICNRISLLESRTFWVVAGLAGNLLVSVLGILVKSIKPR